MKLENEKNHKKNPQKNTRREDKGVQNTVTLTWPREFGATQLDPPLFTKDPFPTLKKYTINEYCYEDDNDNANLGGTLPAEVFNISTTATFLSTAGELLHAIKDWPAKTPFLILL